MPETEPKRNMVEAKVIATLFGLTVRRIQQLTQDGVLQTELVGKQRRYDLLQTVRRYIGYLQEKVNNKGGGKDDTENESRKIKADADLKATKAEIAEMELAELKGEMHRSEDVEAMTTDLVFVIRGMMLALPGRLAIDLANIDKPAEISERIKQEVNAILLELSNYKYDPEAYKKRVRDRQGWNELIKDDDESEGDGAAEQSDRAGRFKLRPARRPDCFSMGRSASPAIARKLSRGRPVENHADAIPERADGRLQRSEGQQHRHGGGFAGRQVRVPAQLHRVLNRPRSGQHAVRAADNRRRPEVLPPPRGADDPRLEAPEGEGLRRKNSRQREHHPPEIIPRGDADNDRLEQRERAGFDTCPVYLRRRA